MNDPNNECFSPISVVITFPITEEIESTTSTPPPTSKTSNTSTLSTFRMSFRSTGDQLESNVIQVEMKTLECVDKISIIETSSNCVEKMTFTDKSSNCVDNISFIETSSNCVDKMSFIEASSNCCTLKIDSIAWYCSNEISTIFK